MGGDQDPRSPDSLGQFGDVQSSRPSETHQDEVGRVLSPFHRDHAQGSLH